jgi:hypothetical protein
VARRAERQATESDRDQLLLSMVPVGGGGSTTLGVTALLADFFLRGFIAFFFAGFFAAFFFVAFFFAIRAPLLGDVFAPTT